MKALRLISKIIVGVVFVFSGIVKAIDPLGTTYKFHDYFEAFNLEFLQFLVLPLTIILCLAEFISGFSVLTGYRQKTGIWGVMLLMFIFTPLTLVVALTNPVSDCGCFGDAFHLTNWQTFGKNIFLMIFTVILFSGRKRVVPRLSVRLEWFMIVIISLLFVIFSLLNLKYLPLIDFLPYKTGINISESMKIPEGKPADKYETTFIYEKDGIQKEFTLENYPSSDTMWKFVDQKSILVQKGFQPPIHDFSFTVPGGTDITGDILNSQGYTLLLVSKKFEEADPQLLRKGFELGTQCQKNGIGFYILTASGEDVIKKYDDKLTVCQGDETTLKTMVRANPGYILIKEGTIAGKWSWANIPDKEFFNNSLTEDQVSEKNNKAYKLAILLSGISVILILLFINLRFRRKRCESEN